MRRQARVALLHELGQLLDRSQQGGFSHDPRLLDLAGWQVGTWPRLWLRQNVNPFSDRSPDRYELQSPREHVAVNLEHFVLDADYACQRPLLADYFARRLGIALDRQACAAGIAFFEEEARALVLILDPVFMRSIIYWLKVTTSPCVAGATVCCAW